MSGPTKEILTWTGDVRINEAHLNDPLKWRKPAIIATGFHGDWGLLPEAEKDRMFAVMALCPQHRFFPLTKHNLGTLVHYFRNGEWRDRISSVICDQRFIPREQFFRGMPSPAGVAEGIRKGWRNLEHVNFGVSVMAQADADAALPHMIKLAQIGARTHCWHEPAIGPVDWRGWEFLTWLVVGGQSAGTEPFDVQWARNAIAWGRANGVPVKIKQLGSLPVIAACTQNHFDWGEDIRKGHVTRFSDYAPELWRINLKDHRGSNPSEWPEDLRVRQMPDTQGVRETP
jgi:protein gp37